MSLSKKWGLKLKENAWCPLLCTGVTVPKSSAVISVLEFRVGANILGGLILSADPVSQYPKEITLHFRLFYICLTLVFVVVFFFGCTIFRLIHIQKVWWSINLLFICLFKFMILLIWVACSWINIVRLCCFFLFLCFCTEYLWASCK